MMAKQNTPIDTSSLRESIRVSEVIIDGDRVSARLIAGGLDFTHTYFRETGKRGNVVDYAIDQEIIHNFLGGSIATIVDAIKHPR
jgi:hypothetical protein